jgi:3'-5' exoribonuclease
LTGALLHDVGKTLELSHEAPFNYTDRGRLMGHLVIGSEMIQERISRLTDFPDDCSTRLQHLVLSHHGRHEFGSPTLPMLGEAFVLHFLDDLDAKMNYLGRLEEKAAGPGYQWTEFQRTLERFLFINGRPHAEDSVPGTQEEEQHQDETKSDSRQQPLFG